MTKEEIWARCLKQNPRLALAPDTMVGLKASELKTLLDFAWEAGAAQGAALVVIATPRPDAAFQGQN
jgi:hypothetical protein